jgi:hypothetical protein
MRKCPSYFVFLNQSDSEFLCSKIYLKTEYAWYIVDTPSKLYRPYFISFWLQHRVLHLLVTSALANSSITLAKFFKLPQVKADALIISQMLGRPLVRDDMLSENTVRPASFQLHAFDPILEILYSDSTFKPPSRWNSTSSRSSRS